MPEYDLEIPKIIEKIKNEDIKSVLIQLPDGLKPKADEIEKELSKHAEVFIWFGSCYGACDFPKVNVDLLVSFGHSGWKY